MKQADPSNIGYPLFTLDGNPYMVVDIDLQRFAEHLGSIVKHSDGEYVRYADVCKLFGIEP